MKIETVKDLFDALCQSGYISPEIVEGDAENIGHEYIEKMMELDRRTIFLYWFGENKAEQYGSNKPLWHYHYVRAEEDYINGYADSTIKYILTREIAELPRFPRP
jgi:hypothetical protein